MAGQESFSRAFRRGVLMESAGVAAAVSLVVGLIFWVAMRPSAIQPREPIERAAEKPVEPVVEVVRPVVPPKPVPKPLAHVFDPNDFESTARWAIAQSEPMREPWRMMNSGLETATVKSDAGAKFRKARDEWMLAMGGGGPKPVRWPARVIRVGTAGVEFELAWIDGDKGQSVNGFVSVANKDGTDSALLSALPFNDATPSAKVGDYVYVAGTLTVIGGEPINEFPARITAYLINAKLDGIRP